MEGNDLKPIVVVGSMNMDIVFQVENSPAAGETVFGHNFITAAGGKGANQAAAAGNLGGVVQFISACGKDDFGKALIKSLHEKNVDTKAILVGDKHTGVANIVVEKSGENRIIVVPGANSLLTADELVKFTEIIRNAAVLLLQLEIPLETVILAIETAHAANVKVILDPAPACKLPKELFDKIDYILPNEGELEKLFAGSNLKTSEEKIEQLLNWGVGSVLVTKGGKGCSIYKKNVKRDYRAYAVQAVDTTAAGDTFAGAFAFGLQSGYEEDKSIKFAMAAAALSVMKLGAQSSLPTFEEVSNFSLNNAEMMPLA